MSETKTKNEIVVNVPMTFGINRICELIEATLGGAGSDYWATDRGIDGITKEEIETYRTENDLPEYGSFILAPFAGGKAVLYEFDEGSGERTTRREITLESIQNGIKIMAEKYPSHFADWMNENEDLWTGDTFLQLISLGEIVYG